ncbi:hypothetical protein V6Z12_D05G228800 [Gossypium hirsutum]
MLIVELGNCEASMSSIFFLPTVDKYRSTYLRRLTDEMGTDTCRYRNY